MINRDSALGYSHPLIHKYYNSRKIHIQSAIKREVFINEHLPHSLYRNETERCKKGMKTS